MFYPESEYKTHAITEAKAVYAPHSKLVSKNLESCSTSDRGKNPPLVGAAATL